MTKKELAKYFNKTYQCIENAFLAAKKEHPELRTRDGFDGCITVDYTLDEILTVIPYLVFKVSNLEIELLKENFIHRKEDYVSSKKEFDPMVPGMKKFLEETKDYHYRPCCETCAYLSAKPFRTTRLKPFCSFYQFFMHLKSIDIFHDYCKTYQYKKREPVIWYKENAPVDQTNFKAGIDTDNKVEIDF